MSNSTNEYQAPVGTKEAQFDYILIDGSSSMMGVKWDDSIRAVDAYIAGLRAEGIHSHTYVHVFSGGLLGGGSDDKVDTVAWDGPIHEMPRLHGALGCPTGVTPLYDAVAIMARRMRDREPEKGAILIVTDGEEGGSQTTDLTQAKAFLDWLRAKGYPVTFIGADFSNHEQARGLGADKSNAIGVQRAFMSDAARNLAKKRANHARGNAEDINFSEEEQSQFGGYLAAPKGDK